MADSSKTRLIESHARVMQGDRAALEQLAEDLWVPLRHRLRCSFSCARADQRADAATDAIMAYAVQPRRFDVARNVPLDAFVFGIAARILRDRLRSDSRRTLREDSYAQHVSQKHADNLGMMSMRLQQVRQALPLVCNPSELAAMTAWLDGDDIGALVACLGAADLAPIDQRRQLERLMTRVIKRLQRHFHADKGHRRPIAQSFPLSKTTGK